MLRIEESFAQSVGQGGIRLLRPIPRIVYDAQQISHSSNYKAFPFSALLGGSIVLIYSDGDAHGDSDRQYMVRSDDGGRTWLPEVVFWDESAPTAFDFSLIEDLMTEGDVVTLKVWTIVKLESGCFAYTNATVGEYSNAILFSDDTENAVWKTTPKGILPFGQGSAADSTDVLDPIGGRTANFILLSSDEGSDSIQQVVAGFRPDQPLSFSRWFKHQLGGPSWIRLFAIDADAVRNGIGCYFNIRTGEVGQPGAFGEGSGASGSVKVGPEGWYCCTLSGQPNTTGKQTLVIERPTNGRRGNRYTGDGIHGYYHWRAQLEPGLEPHHPLLGTATTAVATNTGADPYAYWSRVKRRGQDWYRTGYASTGTGTVAALFRSTDGYGWIRHATLAGAEGKDFGEADFEVLANQDWIAVIREDTGAGRPLYQSRSTDGGMTFGKARLMGIEGVQPNLITLADGSVLLAMGDRTGATGLSSSGAPGAETADLTGVSVSIADPNAETWSGAVNIGLSWSTDCGQPMSFEIEPGIVNTVMYLRAEEALEPGIYSVTFNPDDLRA